jgi:hypothetical protein
MFVFKIPGTPKLLMREATHPKLTISIGGEWMERIGTCRQPYPVTQKFNWSRLAGME